MVKVTEATLMLMGRFCSLDMNSLFRSRSNNVGERYNFIINMRDQETTHRQSQFRVLMTFLPQGVCNYLAPSYQATNQKAKYMNLHLV